MKFHDNLIDNMMTTISRYRMADRGQKLLVGVSGGPDSVVLLHALHTVSDYMGFSLHAAHLDHSFRGAESDRDAVYVQDFAALLGVDSTIEKADVPAACVTLRMSSEQAAREIRYDFFQRTAVQVGADRIVVAHTADDQVETCIMNLLRGTGIDGLAGIPPVRDNIIRPLINIPRCDIEAYILRHGLHPRIDSTNLLPIYRRNKVRLELLPYLRHHYNEGIDGTLLRLAELAGDDSAYLNNEADRILAEILTFHVDDTVIISVSALRRHHISLNRRIIRQALRTLIGGIKDIGYVHVEIILDLLKAGGNFTTDLPDNIKVNRVYDDLVFTSHVIERPIVRYSYPIQIPGDTMIPEIGVTIRTAMYDEQIEYRRPDRSDDIVVDYDSLKGDLHARTWRPGDRIDPLGLGGSKKVQDIFSDMKIPGSLRDEIPIITDSEKIIWVCGISMSETVKVNQGTNKYLRIIIL